LNLLNRSSESNNGAILQRIKVGKLIHPLVFRRGHKVSDSVGRPTKIVFLVEKAAHSTIIDNGNTSMDSRYFNNNFKVYSRVGASITHEIGHCWQCGYSSHKLSHRADEITLKKNSNVTDFLLTLLLTLGIMNLWRLRYFLVIMSTS
jgi:hypothetical protein